MQESVKGNEKKLDQSQKMAMEDSTAMTIEFLRARLLAERTISQTARQKADKMAKRVAELEEKLNLVTLQRKKAEKATSEVLAILENNGISDFSEVCDSNSEHEGVVGSESKDTDDIKEEEGSLTTSRQRAIQVDETSGLELGVLPLIGRSLSWKSCDHSPISRENRKSLEATRKCSSFVSSGGSSTRYHLGRSRRQKKEREARSAELKAEDHSFLRDSQECEVSTMGDASRGARHVVGIIKESQQNEEEKVYMETLAQGSLDDQRKEANNILASNGSERNVELQRALEYQAHLIGQFKAEENAQREWEEKFKGNSCYSPDSCEHGNQSDITEEREEIRAETSGNVDTNPSLDPGGSEHAFYNGEKVEDRINHIPAQPHKDNKYSEQQFNNPVNHSHNTCHEFSFPSHVIVEARSSEKKKPGCSEKSSCRSGSYGSSKYQEAQFSSSYVGGSFHKGESSGKALQVATHDKTSNGLGGVLDALQRAKLSLKNELNRVSLSTDNGLVVKTTKPSDLVINGDNGMEIPVGSAGLFRVPTSLQYEAPSKPSSLTHYSESESSLARYHSSSRIEAEPKGKYTCSPYSDIASANSTRRSLLDSYMDKGIGLPSSSRYIMYPSYVDLMPRMSASDAFSRNHPGIGLGTSGTDGYSEYNDRMRLDMYKRK